MPEPDIILDHDRAITRLEERVEALRECFDGLHETVGEGFSMLSAKLDALGGVEKRVTALEATEATRVSRVRLVVKIGASVVSTVLAALALMHFGLR